MSGDYSRIAFNPWLDDQSVLLEQGRPLTDRDWNDQALLLNRRTQAGTLDTVGTAVVPMQTPEGFEILVNNGGLTIGRGRIYVHGLLAENHGKSPDGGTLSWDPKLAELYGPAPLGYDEQPYYPNPDPLPSEGTHVAYLDVWQREVTRFIRPDLVEKALGVDTSTRLQTVWQVKLHPASTDTTCSMPLDELDGWLPDHAPSAGRLSVTTVPVPGQPDPCQVPPSAGYKGLENQLYRVEVHQGGEPGTATFKWSRDHASVEAAVLEIPSLTQLVVDSIGKDDVLGFAGGDWIEITDDWLELHGQPGLLRRITANNGVEAATRTITLDVALPAGLFPTDGQNVPDGERHTRIRRWDQKNTIVDAAGVEIQNLNDAASDGAIDIPADGTQVLLEHNIVVSFNTSEPGGVFHSGDYWVFAARAIDGTVEEFTELPPRGVHHHYTKLAVVSFPNNETDCRMFWPPASSAPPAGTPGEECGCTFCVTPESHASGTLTIQDAIDQARERGGGTICIDVGEYGLAEPLQIADGHSLRVVGKGAASRVVSETRALSIDKSGDITLESFSIECRPSTTAPDTALLINSSNDVKVERLSIAILNSQPTWSAIALGSALVGLTLRDNTITAAAGVRSGTGTGGEAGLSDVRIENNAFECASVGLELGGITLHQFVSVIRGNRINGCDKAGIVLEGGTVSGHCVEVSGNSLAVQGLGVVAALDGLRLIDNDILHTGPAEGDQAGVQLQPSAANEDGLDHLQIHGNRISGFGDAGILSRVQQARMWSITGNHLRAARNGIVFTEARRLDQVAVEHNQMADIEQSGLIGDSESGGVSAIGNHIDTRGRVPAVRMMFREGDMIFSDNQVSRRGAGNTADVQLIARTLVVDGNRVRGAALSMDLTAGEAHYTVLGNICAGRIRINNNGIQPPWEPLNRQNV